MKLFPLIIVSLLSCVLASFSGKRNSTRAAVSPAKSTARSVYPLNMVSPEDVGQWSFYVAAAGDTDTKEYLPVMPGIDAANIVRIVGETSEPYRPVMEWEYGYAAGPITIRPESDRNISTRKGDLIALWKAPIKGRYQLQIDVDNIGNDARGGDGGTIILSRLGAGKSDDTQIIERIGIPASGYQSAHVKRYLAVEVETNERILLRLNAGIDGFADLWRMRYVIARLEAKNATRPSPH